MLLGFFKQYENECIIHNSFLAMFKSLWNQTVNWQANGDNDNNKTAKQLALPSAQYTQLSVPNTQWCVCSSHQPQSRYCYYCFHFIDEKNEHRGGSKEYYIYLAKLLKP